MSVPSFLPTDAYSLIGIAGFGLYVTNYTFLTLQRISSDHTMYFVLNLLAAGMVMVGLMSAFNLAAAMLQSFWIVMSAIGIMSRLRRTRAHRRAAPPVRDEAPIASDVRARLDAIESRVAPPFVSRRQPAGNWGDVTPETYFRDRESERRTLLHATD